MSRQEPPVTYGLLVKFPSDSQDFVNGFEAGMIWADLQSGKRNFEMLSVRNANREVIDRMFHLHGLDVIWTELEGPASDEWAAVSARPA